MTTFVLIKVINHTALMRAISGLRRYNPDEIVPVTGEFDIVVKFSDHRYVSGIIREIRLIPNITDVRVLQSYHMGGGIGG